MKCVTFVLAVLNFLVPVLCNFDLLILHNNDIHGRFEETERNSGSCQAKNRNKTCIGGFARTAHEIRKYRKAAQDGIGPEVLFLNAGDTFIGTVWYTIHTWNISSTFMNLINPDAQSLGNHEFDKGPDELALYLAALNFPTVTCNLDLTNEATVQSRIHDYVILEKGGRKIGIIGYLTPETEKISSPRETRFLDEIEEIRKRSEILDQDGVKIIIALGHSGYLKDKEIAEKVPLVDVVVGGHTNTFLWNGPQPDIEAIDGPYPTIITQQSGKKVPVVQAYAYTKYLGRLNLTFDDNGNVLSSTGQPELLDNSIPQDEDVLQILETYRPATEQINNDIVATLPVTLDEKSCRTVECNYGNLIADANVFYKATTSLVTWTDSPIGLMNGGSIRASVTPGLKKTITRGEILETLPFGNQIISLKLSGADLVKTLELGVRSNGETSLGEFLQVSGLQVVYDRSRPPMSRVVSVKTRCGACEIPTYEDIDLAKNYSIVTTDYLADGFDGHYILKNNSFDKKKEDLGDVEVLVWYFKSHNPVFAEVEGRIRFVNSTTQQNSGNFLQPVTLNILLLITLSVRCR